MKCEMWAAYLTCAPHISLLISAFTASGPQSRHTRRRGAPSDPEPSVRHDAAVRPMFRRPRHSDRLPSGDSPVAKPSPHAEVCPSLHAQVAVGRCEYAPEPCGMLMLAAKARPPTTARICFFMVPSPYTRNASFVCSDARYALEVVEKSKSIGRATSAFNPNIWF